MAGTADDLGTEAPGGREDDLAARGERRRRRIMTWLAVGLAVAVVGEGVALWLRGERGRQASSAPAVPARVVAVTPAVPTPPPLPAPAQSVAPAPVVTPLDAAPGSDAEDLTDQIVDVTASSFKAAEGDHVYTPMKAFDGRADTAWNEGAVGPGVGEWIEARFKAATLVDHVVLTAGWDYVTPRGRDLFTSNRHLTDIRVEYDGGAKTFHIPDGVRLFRADLGGVVTARVRIVATAVSTEDAKWDDLAISEIRVYGRR